MSDQDKERERAEIRAQAKAEMNRMMGISDSEDETEKREMSDQDKGKELTQAEALQEALERSQALADMQAEAKADIYRLRGLDISEDENENRESPYDYMPYLVSHPKGSAKEIEAALRMRGLQLRRDLNQSLSQNPEAWKALNRPAPLHSASLTLAEML